jgi:ribosomal protein L37E
MLALRLTGHYKRPVDLDLCEHCHLVWFDDTEAMRLAGPGVLDLIEAMARVQTTELPTLRDRLSCQRCSASLHLVSDRTMFGPTARLECPERHGALQSFALHLAQLGLVRPLKPADLPRDGNTEPLECLNCGATVHYESRESCSHCGSPLLMLDIDSAARLILYRTDRKLALPAGQKAQRDAAHCASCGSAMDSSRRLTCQQCGALIATTQLRRAVPALKSRLGQAERNDDDDAKAALLAIASAQIPDERLHAYSWMKALGRALSQRGQARHADASELPTWTGWALLAFAVLTFLLFRGREPQ